MIKNENILIIGGTGSLGHCLSKTLYKNNNLCVFSRDELKQWEMKKLYPNTQFMVGDVRDYEAISRVIKIYKPSLVILASALKHVDVCENNPEESLKTNILGTKNVLDAIEDNCKDVTFIMVSTDKACAPVNVYGMCKGISERLVAERSNRDGKNRYLGVRYGNVICSRGSIIPLFEKIGKSDAKEFTITHENMTRYFMTLDESVNLIMNAFKIGKSGEIFIPILRAGKIIDLASIFSDIYNKPIKVIGIRPGEKMHEELVNEAESLRTRKEGSSYYIISPAYCKTISKDKEPFNYTSNDILLSKEELKKWLSDNGAFNGIREI